MARLIVFLFLTISCTSISFIKLPDSDKLMYVDYIEYLKILSGGSSSVSNNFGTKNNATFFYKDFTNHGISVIVVLDKITNQQYITFYGYNTAQTIRKMQDAKSVRNFGINATFNAEILKMFSEIMPFLQPKIQKNIKKIIIGSDVGGAMSYLLALELTKNLKMPNSQIEVITFSPIPFAYNFTPDFTSTSIFVLQDIYNEIFLKCCNRVKDREIKIKNKNFNQKNRLESYQNSLKL